MGSIFILGFHGSMVTVVFLLFHYMMGEYISSDILFTMGFYSGVLSAVNITAFIPLFFINKIYRKFQLQRGYHKNHMQRFGHIVAAGTILFTLAVAYYHGFSADTLKIVVVEYYDSAMKLFS